MIAETATLPICKHRHPSPIPGRHRCSHSGIIVSSADQLVGDKTCIACASGRVFCNRDPNPSIHRTSCVHRGPMIDRIECRTCMGGGSRLVHACAIHRRCTDRNLTPKNPRTPKPMACSTCDDFCEF